MNKISPAPTQLLQLTPQKDQQGLFATLYRRG